ncbi:MAG: outer membrane lipoprotein chaperone LolA [Aliivibrio sp.]|uniref:outer membrane lipoprotein chaperone LolA n=1 Tax=Aliivibrio sp. TaxID=1872443 RepID=UPI001A4162D5|nr:outer membrane lipoprotein chaperone LolA [Aliivibrio sp.]
MKKLLLALVCFSSTVFAAPQDELAERLNQSSGFSANFTQQVFSPEGGLIVEGEGDVKISRPNLFRWHTKTPDENLLVADGKTLWYFNPFVEQVTMMWLDQATNQTPFVLLTRNDPKDWANYDIEQSGDDFTLVAKDDSDNSGQFIVSIAKSGVVNSFFVIEQDGQRSEFVFSQFSSQTPDKNNFIFNVPEGVDIDDQRN